MIVDVADALGSSCFNINEIELHSHDDQIRVIGGGEVVDREGIEIEADVLGVKDGSRGDKVGIGEVTSIRKDQLSGFVEAQSGTEGSVPGSGIEDEVGAIGVVTDLDGTSGDTAASESGFISGGVVIPGGLDEVLLGLIISVIVVITSSKSEEGEEENDGLHFDVRRYVFVFI